VSSVAIAPVVAKSATEHAHSRARFRRDGRSLNKTEKIKQVKRSSDFSGAEMVGTRAESGVFDIYRGWLSWMHVSTCHHFRSIVSEKLASRCTCRCATRRVPCINGDGHRPWSSGGLPASAGPAAR